MTDVVEIPCRGCSRKLRYPAGKARAVTRRGETLAVFCSHGCQVKTIAIEAVEQSIRNARDAQQNS